MLNPSDTLTLPGPRARRFFGVIWWLMFAIALAGAAGGVWRGMVQYGPVMRAFSQFGVTAEAVSGECLRIYPDSVSLENVDPDDGACLREVAEMRVDRHAPAEDIARRFNESPADIVRIGLVNDAGAPLVFDLRRAPASNYWLKYADLAGGVAVAILFLFAALLLRLRRSADPVSRRISFAFLALANLGSGSFLFWDWEDLPELPSFMMLAGLGMLLAVLPAFPDGRYVPRAARWLKIAPLLLVVVVPLAIGLVAKVSGSEALAQRLMRGNLAIAFVAAVPFLVYRYAKMPHGLERQQLKWAVFGLVTGLGLLATIFLLPDPPAIVEMWPDAGPWIAGIDLAVWVFAFMLIPGGMLVSLMQYRLNDADAAISKSLGYALVTLIVGVVWAIIQSVVGKLVGRLSGDPMLALAITTMIAALVFAPARTYVLGWTEKKFQRALVRLRALPAKLARWQVGETPEELAEKTLADVVSGVGAASGAILGDNGREWRVLAAQGIDPAAVTAELARERPADRRDDPFPIRLQLADQLNEPDLLAIGPRSDGASYTKDERSAIASVVAPLSDALQACARRERHILAVARSLGAIEQRVAMLEQRQTEG